MHPIGVRVLLLGSTPTANRVAAIIGGDLVGQVDSPDGWPEADLGVSVGYRHKVPASVLATLPIVNLHTGFLPYNRGAYPNVWPLLDGTPAGVTLHWMDEGIDTGDVIGQVEVPVHPWDTAYALNARLQSQAVTLFCDLWPRILDGTAPRHPQGKRLGTTHRKAHLAAVRLRLDDVMTVRQVLNVLRARSYPTYPGVTFTENGQSWEVVVSCRPLP